MRAKMLWRLMMMSWALAACAAATQWRWLAMASGLALAVYLCFSVSGMSRTGLVLVLMLVLLTAGVVWHSGIAVLEGGLRQAIIFAAFMPTARLLRTVAFHDPAIVQIRRSFRTLPAESRPGWMLYAAHALASCLSIGSFAVLAPLLPRERAQRLRLAQMALLGGGLSVIWSPFFVAQAFVAHGYPAVPIWQIVLTGLVIAMLGLGIATVVNRVGSVAAILAYVVPALGPLLLPVVSVVGIVLLLNRFGGYSNIEAMVMAIPPLALLAAWRRRPGHLRDVYRQAPFWVSGMGEEIGIVAMAILFSSVLQHSALQGVLSGWILQAQLPPVILLLAGFLAMVSLEILGLHPILCATLALQVNRTVAGQLPDLLCAMAILLAWSFGSIMSYSGLLPSIAAATLAVPKHRLVYGRNLVFVACAAFLSCLALGAFAL